jgi:hypothetical protein
MKIDRFLINEGIFKPRGHGMEYNEYCIEIEKLLNDYCLKDLDYKYSDVQYYKKNGNLLMIIYINDIINKGRFNKNDNYQHFKKLLSYLEEYTDFSIDCHNNRMRISVLFVNNIEKCIEDLGSIISANKYNL